MPKLQQTPKSGIVPPAEVAATGYKQESLTLTEALAIMAHLQSRSLLCSGCAYRLVTHTNQRHSHCQECMIPGQQYNKITFGKATVIETLLCERLGEWVRAYLLGQGDQGATAKLADNQGNAGA